MKGDQAAVVSMGDEKKWKAELTDEFKTLLPYFIDAVSEADGPDDKKEYKARHYLRQRRNCFDRMLVDVDYRNQHLGGFVHHYRNLGRTMQHLIDSHD